MAWHAYYDTQYMKDLKKRLDEIRGVNDPLDYREYLTITEEQRGWWRRLYDEEPEYTLYDYTPETIPDDRRRMWAVVFPFDFDSFYRYFAR